MNIWEATFAEESPNSTSEPLTQLVSAASLRKAAIKAEAWADTHRVHSSTVAPAHTTSRPLLVLVSLTRRNDVVI
jgi:hypothetical protein